MKTPPCVDAVKAKRMWNEYLHTLTEAERMRHQLEETEERLEYANIQIKELKKSRPRSFTTSINQLEDKLNYTESRLASVEAELKDCQEKKSMYVDVIRKTGGSCQIKLVNALMKYV